MPSAETSDLGGTQRWLRRAVDEGLRGVDLEQSGKDWLAADDGRGGSACPGAGPIR